MRKNRIEREEEVKKMMERIEGKIVFEANLDFDPWTSDAILNEVERQIQEELEKRKIDPNRVKNYRYRTIVEVEI